MNWMYKDFNQCNNCEHSFSDHDPTCAACECKDFQWQEVANPWLEIALKIPDLPILQFLAQQKDEDGCYKWSTHGSSQHMPTVQTAMPDVPKQAQFIKMCLLVQKGFVDGCACGCRGDWTLSAAGENQIPCKEGHVPVTWIYEKGKPDVCSQCFIEGKV